ncbi:MAG: tetratricopeptide repeat protein, partial [Deferribacteraceae bacterium]|nr:tetratricopeptide repeat protein [Deferribacteraceae bacterium]
MKKFLKPAGIFIIVMLIPLFTPVITDAEESSTTLFLRATQYEQQGDYEQAIALYKRILTKENSATVTLKMYELELKRENNAVAETVITKAYSDYPDNSQVSFYYGLFLTNQAEAYEKGSADYKRYYAEATKAFQNALRVEPTERFYVAVAVASQAAGNYTLTENTYKQLIEKLDMPEYYRAIGLLKLEQGKRAEAIKDLEKAITLSDDLQAYLILAELYLKDDKVTKAMEYLGKVAELRPDLASPNQYLGEYYQGTGDYEKAIHYYRQAAEGSTEPGNKAAFLRTIGALALDKEIYQTAYEAFSEALTIT